MLVGPSPLPIRVLGRASHSQSIKVTSSQPPRNPTLPVAAHNAGTPVPGHLVPSSGLRQHCTHMARIPRCWQSNRLIKYFKKKESKEGSCSPEAGRWRVQGLGLEATQPLRASAVPSAQCWELCLPVQGCRRRPIALGSWTDRERGSMREGMMCNVSLCFVFCLFCLLGLFLSFVLFSAHVTTGKHLKEVLPIEWIG